MRNRALKPTLDGGILEDRIVLSSGRTAMTAFRNGANNGFQNTPVLTTRAYWQATERIEDLSEDFADEYADALGDLYDDNDQGRFDRQFDRDLQELNRDLDRVARRIPFGRRNLLPEFQGTVDELLGGGVLNPDDFVNGDDFDEGEFEEAFAREMELALRAELQTYVIDNALTADNSGGTFVVLQSRGEQDTDREIPVLGQVGAFNGSTNFGEGSTSRRSTLARASRR